MTWQWRRLMFFPKPTIAMVNGWCFGGAFTPLVSCDLTIAAEEATFGLSEINWGIIPAGNVMRAVIEKMPPSDALYYLMTGDSRMVRLGPREVIVDRHTDGIAYLRSPHPLGPYPVKMTERLDD